MAFSGVVTLLNLILCLAVGLRMLRAGLGRDRNPELALAVYFLASPFLATICQAIVYGGLVDPRLALPADIGEPVLAVGIFGMAVGGAAVCVFVRLAFRRDSRWARATTAAGIALALCGFAFEALHEGFAITLAPGPGHWTAWAGRTLPMVWLAVESFRYWLVLRRRSRLGLADAVVVNRFLLWGIFSGATSINLAADLIAHVLYATLAGTTTEIVMEVMKPVLIGTMAITMVLGMISAASLCLAFFPPAAYRRRLDAEGLAP